MMIYEVTKGHPMVGNGKCEITAYDGCGRYYYYNGWYNHSRREWRLYPRSSGTTTGMVIVGERDVHIPRSTAPAPKPTPAKAEKPKKPDEPVQIKMV